MSMAAKRRNVLIVTVRLEDMEAVKKRVSDVEGVTDIAYSYLTHKLHVKYEGDEVRLREIQELINKTLADVGDR